MKTSTIVVLAIVGLLVLFGFGYGCGCLGYRQDCVKSEAGIEAQYKQNQNNSTTCGRSSRRSPSSRTCTSTP